MISIIVCSRNNSLASKLSANIKTTIGVPHEIIVFNNRETKMGICEVYNICAEKSKYPILCFAHEDILFHTQNWGTIVNTILSHEQIGLIGVAGASFLSKHNSGWYIGGQTAHTYHLQSIEGGSRRLLKDQNMEGQSLKEVVVLDGLWLCTRKEVWAKNPFDQQNFKGFHFYDLDFSLQISIHFKIYVTTEILIEHASEGFYDSKWVGDSFLFKKKWKPILPVYTACYSSPQLKTFDLLALQTFSYRLIDNRYARKFIVKSIAKCMLVSCYNLKNWRLLIHYLSSSPALASSKRRVKKYLKTCTTSILVRSQKTYS